jgi:hypothetical protein
MYQFIMTSQAAVAPGSLHERVIHQLLLLPIPRPDSDHRLLSNITSYGTWH